MKIKDFTLIILISFFCSCTSDSEEIEYNNLIGIWDLYAAEIESCDFFEDSSFEGVDNNCYDLLDRYFICRAIKWEFFEDNTIELRANDYYPEFDTTIMNSTSLQALFRMRESGDFELCDPTGTDCFTIVVSRQGEIITMDHNETCNGQFRIIPE